MAPIQARDLSTGDLNIDGAQLSPAARVLTALPGSTVAIYAVLFIVMTSHTLAICPLDLSF